MDSPVAQEPVETLVIEAARHEVAHEQEEKAWSRPG
jgi:hypothetical protein